MKRLVLYILLLLIVPTTQLYALSTPKNDQTIENKDPVETPEFAPINVKFHTIKQEYNVLFVYKNYELYAPMLELFELFKIESVFLPNDNKITGFFPYSADRYFIDLNTMKYSVRGRHGTLDKDDVIDVDGVKYIHAQKLNDLFSLTMIIDLSSLRISFEDDSELPITRNALIENKLDSVKDEVEDIQYDAFLNEKTALFRPGRLALDNFLSVSNQATIDSYSIRGGSELLYGDFDFFFQGSNQTSFDPTSSFLSLSYIFPEKNNSIQKIVIGDTTSENLTPIRLRGVMVSNIYETFSGSFNHLNVNGFSLPNAFIEIFRNGYFVVAIKADHTGYYNYKLPVYAGTNFIDLKITGEHGESDSRSIIHSVQSSMLHPDQLFWETSAGQGPVASINYFNADVKYGFNENITLRAGFSLNDYSGPAIPQRRYLATDPSPSATPPDELTFANTAQQLYFQTFSVFLGYFNMTNTYAYDDYISSNLGFMTKETSTNLEVRQSNYSNRASISENVQISESTVRLEYTREWLFSPQHTSDSVSATYTTQLTPKIFLTNTFFTTDLNADNVDVLSTSNVRYNFLSYSFLPTWMNGTDFGVSYNHSLAQGPQHALFQIQQRDNDNNSASYEYGVNFSQRKTSTSHKIDLRKNFDFFYAGLSTSIDSSNNYNVTLSLGTYFGYDDTLKSVYISPYNYANKGGVSAIPFLDTNSNSQYDDGEKLLDEASFSLNGNNYSLDHKTNVYSSSFVQEYKINHLAAQEFSTTDSNYFPSLSHIGFRARPNIYSTIYVPYYKTEYISIAITDLNGNSKPGIRFILEEDGNPDSDKLYELSDFDGELYFPNVKPGKYRIYLDPSMKKSLKLGSEPRDYRINVGGTEPLPEKMKFEIFQLEL